MVIKTNVHPYTSLKHVEHVDFHERTSAFTHYKIIKQGFHNA